MAARSRVLVELLIVVVCTTWLWRAHAWLADDAWISFRAAEHLATGQGLRWNVDERVQAFTNPAWVLLLAAGRALGPPVYEVARVASLALTVAAVAGAWGVVRRTAGGLSGLAVVGCLLTTRAFVHFSSSGLEAPLAYALLAVALAASARPGRAAMLTLWGAASLVLVTRLDLAPLLAPALLASLARRREVGPAVLGGLPLLAWLAFAVLYFGSPLPNTAFAKVANGLSAAGRVALGLRWGVLSLRVDPVAAVGLVAAAVAVARGVVRGASWSTPWALGALLQVAASVVLGGDYMLGRFLAVPLFVAWIAAGAALGPHLPRWGLVPVAAVAVAMGAAAPSGTLHAAVAGPVQAVPDAHGLSDSQPRFRQPYRAWSWRPDGEELHVLERYELGPRRVVVEDGVGTSGWRAGSDVHVVDVFALGDPLLARLPALSAVPGHAYRPLPMGYTASLAHDDDLLADPELRAFYADLRLVTRAPVLSVERLGAVARLLAAPRFATVDDRAVHAWRVLRLEDGQVLSWCLEAPAALLGWVKPARHPDSQHDVLHGAFGCGALLRLDGAAEQGVVVSLSGATRWTWRLLEGAHTAAEGEVTPPGVEGFLQRVVLPLPPGHRAEALWLQPASPTAGIGDVSPVGR